MNDGPFAIACTEDEERCVSKDTVYIVSGFMRTGTSMMMRALEKGGMDARYSRARDRMNAKFGDDFYRPNAGGFYELDRHHYREFGFPRKWKGCLIKALYGALWRMVAGKYKIVFMRRDPEEIRQSYEAFFQKEPPRVLKNYSAVMDSATDMLKVRTDVGLTEFQYRDVVRDPLVAFQRLVGNGWPIDAHKAASIVDPQQCRFRIENLDVGV